MGRNDVHSIPHSGSNERIPAFVFGDRGRVFLWKGWLSKVSGQVARSYVERENAPFSAGGTCG